MGNKKGNKANSENIRCKEAIKQKIKSENEMNKLGLTLQSDLMAIGVIFEYLTISQNLYLGMMSINQFCQENVGVDFSMFYCHYSPPPIKLLCPLLGIQELNLWHHPVVTTSIKTCLEALDYNVPMVFFYVFDPDFIGQYDIIPEDLQRAFKDPRVRIFVRHQDHKKMIEQEFGIQICNTIIPDFDVNAIVKLVAKETKHVENNIFKNE